MTDRAKRILRTNIQGYLFTLPIILGVAIFCYMPAIQSLIYSLFEYDGFNLKAENFIGFDNYIRIFSKDLETQKVFVNTIIYAIISVPLNIVLGYGLALLVNHKKTGVFVYRLLFYLPVIIPGVVSGLLYKDLFDTQYGIFNDILKVFGLEYTFFEDAATAMPTLIFTNLFQIGGGMVIWLAAFKNIPATLYESADLDGGNYFQKLIYITIPMSTSTIFYNLVTGVIGSLQIFSTFIIASGSGGRGPDDSLYFLAVKIYNEAFTRFGNMGYACALGWVLFVVIAILSALIFKFNGWVQYMED